MKKDANKMDSAYYHIAVIKKLDDFEGGSFEYDYCDEDPRGLSKVTGRLIDSGVKSLQRIEFYADQWTEKQVKKWLDINGVEYIKFIKATETPKLDNAPAPKPDSSVTRADFLFIPDTTIPEEMKFLIQPVKKDKDGFLSGRAIATNVGVFPYMMKDGTVKWELRPPEEVFHPDSIASLAMIPITNNHPDELVTPENAKSLQVGFAGGEIVRDAYHLSIPLKITDAKAIEDVERGKRGLSCGYKVDLEEKSGTWMGVPYDAVQRNIRYNHIAIVDKGRAGDDAVLTLDQAKRDGLKYAHARYDAVCVDFIYNQKSKKEEQMDLKTIKLDGVDYQAEAEVIKNLTTLQAKADSLSKEIETLKADSLKIQAERDTLKDTAEQLKKDKAELEKTNPAKIDEVVKSRLAIIKAGEKFGVEMKADMSEMDVKKAVIVKAFPKAAEKLDKAEEAYVNARYDSAVEYLEDNADIANRNRQAAGDQPTAGQHQDTEPDADKSRQDMINRMKNAYKEETK